MGLTRLFNASENATCNAVLDMRAVSGGTVHRISRITSLGTTQQQQITTNLCSPHRPLHARIHAASKVKKDLLGELLEERACFRRLRWGWEFLTDGEYKSVTL